MVTDNNLAVALRSPNTVQEDPISTKPTKTPNTQTRSSKRSTHERV